MKIEIIYAIAWFRLKYLKRGFFSYSGSSEGKCCDSRKLMLVRLDCTPTFVWGFNNDSSKLKDECAKISILKKSMKWYLFSTQLQCPMPTCLKATCQIQHKNLFIRQASIHVREFYWLHHYCELRSYYINRPSDWRLAFTRSDPVIYLSGRVHIIILYCTTDI